MRAPCLDMLGVREAPSGRPLTCDRRASLLAGESMRAAQKRVAGGGCELAEQPPAKRVCGAGGGQASGARGDDDLPLATRRALREARCRPPKPRKRHACLSAPGAPTLGVRVLRATDAVELPGITGVPGGRGRLAGRWRERYAGMERLGRRPTSTTATCRRVRPSGESTCSICGRLGSSGTPT
jgi:hypothetical protein